MKRLLLMAVAVAACSSVSAAPVALPAGPIYIEYRTAEQYSLTGDIDNALNPAAPGVPEANWGIVQVDSIRVGQALSPPGWQIVPASQTVFADGLGPQILGIFYGVQHTSVPPVVSTGGSLDLYWWNSNAQDVAAELNPAGLSKRGGPSGSQYSGFTCLAATLGCTFLLIRHDEVFMPRT